MLGRCAAWAIGGDAAKVYLLLLKLAPFGIS